MVYKSIEKIWLICLWLFSLSLVGCFHVPDEDWLPNKDKINTWNTQRNNEVEEAFNSFINWVDIISSQRSEMKNSETVEISHDDITISTESESIDDTNLNQEIIIEE